MSAPFANIECLFGPDGVGKSTIARQRLAVPEARRPVLLHGTAVDSWADHYPELFESGVLEPFDGDDEAFDDKAKYVSVSARELAMRGTRVVIDGHPLHKTAANAMAGLLPDRYPTPPEPEEFFASWILGQAMELSVDGLIVVHTWVRLPHRFHDLAIGEELQARIKKRGGRSRWDPATAQASWDQSTATASLGLQLFQNGRLLKGHQLHEEVSDRNEG